MTSQIRSHSFQDELASYREKGEGEQSIEQVPPNDERINILLVDDEPRNLTVLESILDDPNYRLICADSANEALTALVTEEFALLILDIQMPDMNGFELAQLIKKRKKTANVPIIFLTAYYSEDQHILEGYGTGAVDFLHKPISPRILKSKVAVFAELYRAIRDSAKANKSLTAEVAERRRAEDALQKLTAELEDRVAARTAKLSHLESILREADRRKDEFLATLAHELRNPLAPIRNSIELIRAYDMDSEELDWAIEAIDRQSLHLTRLVDDLLEISRITTGKLELRRSTVALDTIVQGAVEISQPLIEQFAHELTVDLPSKRIFLNADSTRLSQVLANLLNNAAKYTERGGAIQLSAKHAGEKIEISVKDSGMGIPAEMLPSVFDMFTQVDRHLDRSQGGLGIGLSLVKRLVELHEGTIEAFSQGVNQGSEFIVTFPAKIESEVIPARHALTSAQASPLRILIVDDNQDNAKSLGILLQLRGNEVRTAFDGQTGLEVAEEFRPDAVLLDIGMPKLNGYETCRKIREQSWGKKMVLIAQTGFGQLEDRQNTMSAGFDHHLVKPVNTQDLMLILASCV